MKNVSKILILLLVFAVSFRADAEVIINDDFNGTAETPPDTEIWTADTGIVLDGTSRVSWGHTNDVYEGKVMSAKPDYKVAPSPGTGVRLTITNLQTEVWTGQYGEFIDIWVGLSEDPANLVDPFIAVRDLRWGNLVVDMIGPEYPPDFARKTTVISFDQCDGTWVFEWYTDQIIVYYNGVVQFDSVLDAPALIVPSDPMTVGVYGVGSWSVDSIVLETIVDLRVDLINRIPINGATNVALNQSIMWDSDGPETYKYDIYFATAPIDPGDSPVVSNTSNNYYLPSGGYSEDTTYFWRVDVLEASSGEVRLQGDVFAFTTISTPPDYVDPYVIFDDDFNGPEGIVPDASIWTAYGAGGLLPVQTGKGRLYKPVQDDSNPVLTGIEADVNPDHTVEPTSNKSIKLYFVDLQVLAGWNGTNLYGYTSAGMYGGSNMGAPYFGLRDIQHGDFKIDFVGPDYPPLFHRKSLPYSWDADGTWVFEWSYDAFTGKVLAYYGNTLIFDSSVACPDLLVHEEPMWPQLYSLAEYSIDRIALKYIEPIHIDNPSPVCYTKEVGVDATLSWGDPCSPTAYHYDVYFGTDPDFESTAPVLANTTANAYDPTGDMDFSTKYYWRVDVLNTSGILVARGELLEFVTVVPKAVNVSPADEATEINTDAVLNWSPFGPLTYTYEVYFGTDWVAVTNGDAGVHQGSQEGTSFDPFGSADMDWQTTYYWRIDQRHISNPGNVDVGDVWRFRTIVPVCTPELLYDSNGDCRVDFADFADFANIWLQCNWVPVEYCYE